MENTQNITQNTQNTTRNNNTNNNNRNNNKNLNRPKRVNKKYNVNKVINVHIHNKKEKKPKTKHAAIQTKKSTSESGFQTSEEKFKS